MSALTRPGTYRLRVDGPVTAQSPPFHIETAEHLFAPLAHDSLTYLQAHRDGADQVADVLQRQPSHWPTAPKPSTTGHASTPKAG